MASTNHPFQAAGRNGHCTDETSHTNWRGLTGRCNLEFGCIRCALPPLAVIIDVSLRNRADQGLSR